MQELDGKLPRYSQQERDAEKAAIMRILMWTKDQLEDLGAMHSATYLDQTIDALSRDE
jgi:hypothetical protein